MTMLMKTMLMNVQEPWVSYLIQTTAPPVWPDNGEDGIDKPRYWYDTKDENVYLHAERTRLDKNSNILSPEAMDRPELISVGATIVGGWQANGGAWGALDTEAYTTIRPLGNLPPQEVLDEGGVQISSTRGGMATGPLRYPNFAGHTQRVLGTAGRVYPNGENPFALTIRHKEFTGTYAGHGIRAEMHGGVQDRDPGVRALGFYSDEECTQYLYTTGAFVQGESDWQVDENGDPLTVWYTETPPGNVTPTREDWHIAVLWASIQEGYQTLSASQEEMNYQFWEDEQVVPLPPGEWQDTGVTVTELVGQLYRVSSDLFTGVPIGTPIKFTEQGAVTTFTGLWSGNDDLIQIDPYLSAQIGDPVWAEM